MALSGTWRARREIAGSLKQGTGWNPVHATHVGTGRHSEAPNLVYTAVVTDPNESVSDIVDSDIAPEWIADDEVSNPVWGAGDSTGTTERAGYSGEVDARADTAKGFPSWGRRGIPGGSLIRAIKKGSDTAVRAKQSPYETWGEGWDNKLTGDVEDAQTSDAAQYEMQTSMQQRDRTRAGSQTSGRASEYSAPIRSRIVGMRVKPWSGGLRHYDMTPVSQDQIVRPWWGRQAWTTGVNGDDAPEIWNRPNAKMEVVPRQRRIPSDPWQGEATGQNETYGFVNEDPVY